MPFPLPLLGVKAWPRLVILMYLIVWVVVRGRCWFQWDELSIHVKVLLVMMELLFAPDLAGAAKMIKGKPP